MSFVKKKKFRAFAPFYRNSLFSLLGKFWTLSTFEKVSVEVRSICHCHNFFFFLKREAKNIKFSAFLVREYVIDNEINKKIYIPIFYIGTVIYSLSENCERIRITMRYANSVSWYENFLFFRWDYCDLWRVLVFF